MENNFPAQNQNQLVRQSAVNGLAIVGFLALLAVGMLLAVYAARFVPTALDGVSSAAVSLSQLFSANKHSGGSLSVVTPLPAPTSTAGILPFGGATSTPTTTPRTPAPKKTTPAPRPAAPAPTAGKETDHVYQVGGATSTPALHGLPDLTTHIIAVGYLTSTSTNSFVASTTIPHGAKVAVKFSIQNDGTNITGPWNFSASIPTATNYIFNSPTQQSLAPGDHIEYILGFDQAKAGINQTISITANPTHSVAESNANNNSASASVTVLGN